MFKEVISKLIEKQDLTEDQAYRAMKWIMEGNAAESQIAAYVTALRMKGETVAEIAGSALAMREKAVRIHVSDSKAVDTCGTGGDLKGTFNISTASALVLAGAGVTVAKHGNRSVSSACGSADVLKVLGVNIDLAPDKVEALINKIGIGFLFAPLYHESMRHARKVRQEIGIRTVFNILGPLTNPASALIQVIGVYHADLTGLLARVLTALGSERCFVVHGLDGLDEISLTGPTMIAEGRRGEVRSYSVSPEDFGLKPCRPDEILGGDIAMNGRILSGILEGEKGPRRDIVLMNAAPALVAAGKAENFPDGVALAATAIDSGAAAAKLKQLVELSNA